MNKWNDLKKRVDTALNEAGIDDIDVQVIDVNRFGIYEITLNKMHGAPSLAIRVKGLGEMLVDCFGVGRMFVALLLVMALALALALGATHWSTAIAGEREISTGETSPPEKHSASPPMDNMTRAIIEGPPGEPIKNNGYRSLTPTFTTSSDGRLRVETNGGTGECQSVEVKADGAGQIQLTCFAFEVTHVTPEKLRALLKKAHGSNGDGDVVLSTEE